MDLWQLHIFCNVIELKSFSKAGNVIHLTQPTISSHIKDLENHFGCRLIDRKGKEALPTKAGELLYNYACRLLSLRDETESAMAEFAGALKGRLIIGGSTIPGNYILPRIIGMFSQNHPGISISLTIGDTKKVMDDCLSGAIELGVVGAKIENKRISQKKLLEDDMCIIAPFDYKWNSKKEITLNMLLKEPFIIREKGSGTLKSIQSSLSKKGESIESLNIVAEMGSTTSVIQGIKNNIGISILSAIAVKEELQTGSLKAFLLQDLDLKRNFYIIHNNQRTRSPLCNLFTKFIKKKFKA